MLMAGAEMRQEAAGGQAAGCLPGSSLTWRGSLWGLQVWQTGSRLRVLPCGEDVGLSLLELGRKWFVPRRADNRAQRCCGWASGECRERELQGQTDITRGQEDGIFIHLKKGFCLRMENSVLQIRAFGPWGV